MKKIEETNTNKYNMNAVAVSTYIFLVISSFFSNKYVLSTLGFRFPMVFQGWQTLVGFLILRLLAYIPSTTSPTLTGEFSALTFSVSSFFSPYIFFFA